MENLLIVDDSISVRKALERMLASHQFQITSSESAKAALQALTVSAPQLIIADVVMPDMDGFELCQVIKANETYQHIPVILISGIVNSSVQEQAKKVGAVDVIKKPFNPTDLLPTIHNALNQAPQIKSKNPVTTKEEPVTNSASGVESVQKTLQPFLDKEDIESVLLINRAGDCLFNLGKTIDDASTFAEYFKFFSSAAGVLGAKLEISLLQSVLLEYQSKCLLMSKVDEDISVVLTLRDMTVLSVARFLLKRQLPAIEKALLARV